MSFIKYKIHLRKVVTEQDVIDNLTLAMTGAVLDAITSCTHTDQTVQTNLHKYDTIHTISKSTK